MKEICKYTGLILLAVFLLSCANTHMNRDWDARIGPQKFYAEPYVVRSTAPMSVVPSDVPSSPPSAMMYSFQLEQDVDYREKLGDNLGELFYKNWVGKGVFPQMVYEGKREFPGKSRALEFAKKKGVDLVIRGVISNYMFGGSQGTTSLNVQVDIYRVSDGMLIWSMQHSGRIENTPVEDYILWKREVRMPESPEYVIMSALAKDLAKPVKRWSYGKDWRKATEEF
ncbi:MAG: hypothetical protein ACOCZ2_05080 [Thermodesulfobacteriota bacterium]